MTFDSNPYTFENEKKFLLGELAMLVAYHHLHRPKVTTGEQVEAEFREQLAKDYALATKTLIRAYKEKGKPCKT